MQTPTLPDPSVLKAFTMARDARRLLPPPSLVRAAADAQRLAEQARGCGAWNVAPSAHVVRDRRRLPISDAGGVRRGASYSGCVRATCTRWPLLQGGFPSHWSQEDRHGRSET
jgi:hypothetical protein